MSLVLPERTKKPRQYGITSLHDVSTTVSELTAILEDYGQFADFAKIGVGAAYIMPKLSFKLAAYKEAGITTYFGGTLFEKFFSQGKLDEYLIYLNKHGVNWIEVSSGTVDISIEQRAEIVTRLSKDFNVISEVGSKDADKIMPPSEWIEEVDILTQAGSKWVVMEGRQTGTAGIFRLNGEVRTGLVADILKRFGSSRLIFEAPNSAAQSFFVNQVGSNVNLGNVHPRDLLLLESLRQGLRQETFLLK